MAEDALAKARAIAAKLSGGIISTDLGKRKNRWDEDPNSSTGGFGLGAIKKKKVYIPVKDYPGINFLGLLIGPRGSTQKQLQESSGAKIVIRGKGAQKESSLLMPHADDDDELHVSIEGTDEAIERALKDVQEILYNPEQAMKLKENQLQSLAEMNGKTGYQESSGSGDDYQIELRVPNNMVGLVIGKGGENIHKMQTQTGAHMQIAKESDMKPGETLRSIWLKGNPVAVAELKIRVEDIINARMNPSQTAVAKPKQDLNARELENAFVIKIPVPNDKVGVVIGKGGMTIKAIQERTRATVLIPTGPDADNPEVRTLSIGADTKESADAAQMEIFMTLQSQQQQQTQQQVSSLANAIHIAVPDDKVGLVIGKGGMTIKDIQSRTRVRIQIPQAADPGTNPPIRTLTIIGPPESQHLARYEIELVITGQSQNLGASNAYGTPTGGQQGYYGWGAQVSPATSAYAMPYQMPTTAYAGYPSATPTMYDAQAQAAYYGMQYGQQQTATAEQAATTTPEVPTDPTAYYNDYWLYASYYGEVAARTYYGAWSPPEGTPPPAGIVVADPSSVPANPTNPNAPSSDTSGASATDNSSSTAATAENSHQIGSEKVDAIAVDSETAERQWEEYKKQYAQWYEEHGREAGADPNPQRPQ